MLASYLLVDLLVRLQHANPIVGPLLVCSLHLVWMVQSARLLAILVSGNSGNWNSEPKGPPRLLALLRRRKTPKRTDDKTNGRAWKDKSS